MTMKKKLFKKLLNFLTFGMVTASMLTGSLTVNADVADSGNNLITESNVIDNLRNEAIKEYASKKYTNSSIPSDYRVLFVECKSIATNNSTYNTTPVDDSIFNEAVQNFEKSVESFSNYNVNIITEKKYITNTITCTGASYVQYSDIQDYLSDLAPSGYYDAVLVCGAVSEFTLGVASKRQFDGATGYGYAYVTICTNNDRNSINKAADESYPYLYTTNVAIHEWLHTLEAYGELGIAYPNTHGYLEDYTEKSAASVYSSSASAEDDCCYCTYEDVFEVTSDNIDAYSEDHSISYANSSYYNDYYRWPVYQTSGIEARLTNFYKAVLRGEVYNISESRNVGMFPKLWNMTPRKMFLGTYTLKLNNNNMYFYNNNGSLSYTSNYTNDSKFQWNLVYDFKNGNIAIISNSDYRRFDITNLYVSPTCLNLGYSTGYSTAQTFKPILNSDGTYKFQCVIPGYSSYYIRLYESSMGVSNINSYNNWVLTKVNAYEGEYYIKSVSENKYLTVNDRSMSVTGFAASDNQKWKLRYYNDGFYTISPSSNTSLYFDVNNNSNTEGRLVALGKWTGYPTAQSWQLRYNSDGSYYIVPLVSTTRGLTYNNGFSITTLNGNDNQKWIIERVDGGKEIFEGKYKIKNSNNKYLGYDGNTLNIGQTASTWSFKSYGDNYYFISPIESSSTLYWDVNNNYDFDDNRVQLHIRTGYNTAQTWKIVMQDDGSVAIIPMVSLTRGLAFINSISVISTSYDYWYLEKVD